MVTKKDLQKLNFIGSDGNIYCNLSNGIDTELLNTIDSYGYLFLGLLGDDPRLYSSFITMIMAWAQ